MSEKFVSAGVTILVAIIGVAAIAVLVSRNAQTAGVFSALSQGISGALCTATSPVTGQCTSQVNRLPSIDWGTVGSSQVPF